ncbi:MAG: hypothetical protein CME64_11845 [Halobacteriovoraceae bacterium]|nr:hypothetical protein [Halobacteriovoraceae bacterium]
MIWPWEQKMMIDIHTHTLSHDPELIEVQVMDSSLPAGLAFPSSRRFCYGLHPWHVEEIEYKDFLDRLKSFVQMPGFFALGEIGLDRARKETWEKQLEVFEHQMEFAARFKIQRVVIHCVKAYSDIIPFLKKARPSTKFLFHDFNGNAQTYKQLREAADCYFSFGARLFTTESTAVKNLNLFDKDRIFFETDDQPDKTIKDIYARCAEILETPQSDLEAQLTRNFEGFCV